MKLASAGDIRDVAVPAGLELRALGPGSFELRRAGATEVFHCVKDGSTVHLHWRGRAYALRVVREGARASDHAAPGALEAPMPGKVIKVGVALGQRVKKGDEILVIEAMKMENQLRAPRDGRVVRLAAKPGDMVGPGTVLAEIE
jgi:biotin carboxyl carrier protein